MHAAVHDDVYATCGRVIITLEARDDGDDDDDDDDYVGPVLPAAEQDAQERVFLLPQLRVPAGDDLAEGIQG